MKKNIFTLSILAVAALALFSCAKVETEILTPEESKGVPFEIVAGSVDTKTTNSGKAISWVADDAITLFHAESGSSTYGSNDRFSITSANLTSNKFTGTLTDGALDPSKLYDWYAFYPYVSYITSPNNTDAGYRAIGSANKTTPQVQAENNSMAHLSGQYFPLYGKIENVDAADTPSLTLKPALAIIKVHVINAENDPLTVSSISISSAEDITGQYFIAFNGESPVFTPRESNTAKTVQLNVTSGSAISKGSAADFYLAVKPFTAANGTKLTIAVNSFSKSVTMTSDFTFPAGKITNLNFNYDLPDYDVLTYSTLGISGSGYKSWSGKAGSYSSAVYAGQSNANDNNFIQIRFTSPSGIVSTTSGGYLNKVVVDFDSSTNDGRVLSVYGKNAPYVSAAELYDENTRGTLIGTIVKGTSTQVVAENYFAYVGIVSDGVAYLNEVDLYWGVAKTPVSAPTDVEATVSGTTINVSWKDVESNVGSYIVTCSGQAPQVIAQGTKAASFTSLANDTYTITVQAVPSDVALASGAYSYSNVVSTSATVTAAVSEVWKLTDLADITTSDVFVIVGTNTYGSYALPHSNGTSSAPSLVEVTTTTGGGITKLSGAVGDGIKWNLSGDNTNGYIFYPNGSTTTWLFITNTNNGVRVGTQTSNKSGGTTYTNIQKFKFTDASYLQNVGITTRYLSIYVNGTIPTDWRCYANTDSAPEISFYVFQ